MRSHSSFPLTADDEHCAVKFLWASFTSMVLSATAPLAPHWASEVPAPRHGRSSRRVQVDTQWTSRSDSEREPEIGRRRAGTHDPG